MSALHTTTHYIVERLDGPIEDEQQPSHPLNYRIVNVDTNVPETYCTFLPAAIDMADKLNDAMERITEEDNKPRLTTVS